MPVVAVATVVIGGIVVDGDEVEVVGPEVVALDDGRDELTCEAELVVPETCVVEDETVEEGVGWWLLSWPNMPAPRTILPEEHLRLSNPNVSRIENQK